MAARKKPITAEAVLTRTLELITTGGSWVKGHFAQNKKFRTVEPESRGATCFCLQGAIRRAVADLSNQRTFGAQSPSTFEARCDAYTAVKNVVSELYGTRHIPTFNDSPETTHREVVTVVKLAQKRVQEQACKVAA